MGNKRIPWVNQRIQPWRPQIDPGKNGNKHIPTVEFCIGKIRRGGARERGRIVTVLGFGLSDMVPKVSLGRCAAALRLPLQPHARHRRGGQGREEEVVVEEEEGGCGAPLAPVIVVDSSSSFGRREGAKREEEESWGKEAGERERERDWESVEEARVWRLIFIDVSIVLHRLIRSVGCELLGPFVGLWIFTLKCIFGPLHLSTVSFSDLTTNIYDAF